MIPRPTAYPASRSTTIRLIALLAAVTLMLAGCGGSPAEGVPTSAASPAGAAALDPTGHLARGDPARGQALFNQLRSEVGFACATCHRVDSTAMLIGPGLLGLDGRAAARVDGLTAAEYVHQSIVAPDAYVVAGYPAGQMPATYTDLFTPQEIADLVAYARSLE